MYFETYQKAVTALGDWGANENKGLPDSRDPAFQPYLTGAEITSQDYEKAIVCLTAWRLGQNNLYRGIMSVAHVFRNQSLQSESGSIYLQASRRFYDNTDFPEPFDGEFQKMLRHVDELLEGQLLDTTNGAVFFTDSAKAEYGKGILERTGVSGTLTFYK